MYPNPFTLSEATDVVNEWLNLTNVVLIEPGPRHWQTLQRTLADVGIGHNLVTDAHLAALAIEHRATLASSDRDMLRFRGLRVVNPLDD